MQVNLKNFINQLGNETCGRRLIPLFLLDRMLLPKF